MLSNSNQSSSLVSDNEDVCSVVCLYISFANTVSLENETAISAFFTECVSKLYFNFILHRSMFQELIRIFKLKICWKQNMYVQWKYVFSMVCCFIRDFVITEYSSFKKDLPISF